MSVLLGIIAIRVCRFYNRGKCVCVQDRCTCSGLEALCTYPIGRLCHEEELKETEHGRHQVRLQ